ncbi:MAG: hypothetical protein ACYSTY_09530, partial [Planctomycetota bacterium]
MHLRTAFLWMMIASLSLAAATGVVALIWPDFGSTQENILASSLLVGAFSIAALACATVLGKRRLVSVMWAGIGASGLALGVWLIVLWFDPWRWQSAFDYDELLWKSGGTFTVASLWAAHLGLLWLPRLHHPNAGIVRWVTVGLAAALAICIEIVMLAEVFEEWTGRLIGVLAILTACGTVITPTLALIEHIGRRGRSETIPGHVRVSLTCPRCRTSQQVRIGSSKCEACGLRINLEMEQPCCTCGYLLYRLSGEVCPECGRRIPVQDRWAAMQEQEDSPR